MTSISIIVPCRNEKNYIRGFLEGILRQDLDGLEWEVILADGHSSDGTGRMIAEWCASDPRFRMIENPGRIVSTGLNLAIRAATGSVIVRMDVHTAYAPDYIRGCVACLEETGADCVGGPWRARGTGYVSRAIAAAFQSPFSAGGARSHDVDYEGPVDTVYLGCWRRATLEALGMFDETLVRNQDDELNLRIVLRGGRVWQSPAILSWYCPRSSLRALLRQYYQYGFWKVAVIRKHGRPASIRHLVPGLFVAGMCGLLVTGLAAQAVGQAPIARGAAILAALGGGGYVAALLAGSLITAIRKGWTLFPALPAAFACFHLGYGVGFLTGLAYWRRRDGSVKLSKTVTEITR